MTGLSDLYWRLRRMIGRGRGIVQDDSGPVQLVQVTPSNLETFDKMPRVAEYGFQSSPPDGWDAVAVFFSGDRSSGVVVATNHQQFRIKNLKKGEVCISDNQGQQIYFKNGGGILMTDKAGSVMNMNGDGTGTLTFGSGLTINADTKFNGDVTATGTIIGQTEVVAKTGGVAVHLSTHTTPTAPTGGLSAPTPGS